MPCRRIHIAAALALLAPSAIPAASAGSSSGGQRVPDAPTVSAVRCVASNTAPCPKQKVVVRGQQAVIEGSDLDATDSVVFRGAKGAADDARAKPSSVSPTRVVVRVPAAAKSGRVVVVSGFGAAGTRGPISVSDAPQTAPVDAAPGGRFFLGGKRQPVFTFNGRSDGPVQVQVVRDADGAVVKTIQATAVAGQPTQVRWDGTTDAGPAANGQYHFALAGNATAASADPAKAFAMFDHVFPIRGKHNLGYTATNDFGGPRKHKGQDMFAACGTPIAAARGGRVEYAGYQSEAGNYLVINGDSGQDYVYMHMRKPALVSTGQKVFTGQQVGEVGETGRAEGCHLHFELWSAPGWYKGGAAFDPKPQLRAWDAYS